MSARDEDDALTTVATFSLVAEAEIARTRLEAAGIDAHVADAMTTTLVSHMTPALGGVRLQVAARHAEEARELLGVEAAPGHPFRTAHSGEEPSEDPPGEVRARELEAAAARAFRAAILGVFVCPGPLHLYSMVVLLGLRGEAASLTPKARRYVTWGWVVNVVVVAGIVVAAAANL